MLIPILALTMGLAPAFPGILAAAPGPQLVAQEEPQPADGEAPTPPTGPMRLEMLRIIETRVWTPDTPGPNETSGMRFQMKLTGERFAQIVRAGDLIIEKMVDDKGNDLIKPDSIKDRQKTATQKVTINPRALQQGYMPREQIMRVPARGATRIAEAEGYVNLVYGGETETINIRDPLQYEGQNVDHPRLKELGITCRILKLGEEADEPGDGRGIALKFTDGEDHIQNVGFNDAWYRRMNARPRAGKTTDEESRYAYYAIGGGRLDADCEMAITVYPKIERETVRFSLKDVALP